MFGGDGLELNNEALGERINRLRKEKGITQSLLAERVSIEASNYKLCEQNCFVCKRIGRIIRINKKSFEDWLNNPPE